MSKKGVFTELAKKSVEQLSVESNTSNQDDARYEDLRETYGKLLTQMQGAFPFTNPDYIDHENED